MKKSGLWKKLMIVAVAGTLAASSLAACGAQKSGTMTDEEAQAFADAMEEAQNETIEELEGIDEELQKDLEEISIDFAEEDVMYQQFSLGLDAILAVQPGTAGSSLRAEEAVDVLTDFVAQYGETITPEEVGQMTSDWIEIQVDENGMSVDDFAEAVSVVVDATDGKSIATLSGYNYTCQGIMETVGLL